MKFGGRQPVLRIEDERLLTGRDRFTDNLALEGQAHVVFVRSPHPHARIGAIDVAAALAGEGVVAVLTGADLVDDGVGALPFPPIFQRPDGEPMSAPPRRPLADRVVRYVGEPVAAVVAETHDQAEDAALCVDVDYEPLPAVTDVRSAIAEGAPALWPGAPGNVVAEARYGDRAATDAAFAEAATVVDLRIVNNRLVPSAMEPRAALGRHDPDDGRTTLYMGSQNPATVRQVLSEAILKVPPESVRVLVNDIGGGFGMKSGLNAEEAFVAYAAKKLGRPVKWRAGRGEEFQAGSHGRDQVSEAALALDGDGRILAMRAATHGNVGAYLHPAGAAVPLLLGPRIATGVYDVPALDLVIRAVLTNTASVAPYRGAGRPEAIYLIERLIDKAAWVLGTDAIEMRRRNMIKPRALPYRTATGEVYDVGDFPRILENAVAEADWNGFPARRAQAEQAGRLRGRGLGAYIEWTGAVQLTEKVIYRLDGDGQVTVWSATQAMGQGLETSYAQIAAEALGLPIERIVIRQGDTDRVQGFGSMASRSLFVGGSAVHTGARRMIEEARRLAADVLEAAVEDIEYANGRLTVSGTDLKIDIFSLAERQEGGAIVVEDVNTLESASWPNGCHVCEVEIDPATGVVEIDRYTALDDIGIAINPMIVTGQVHGGIAQGIGQALLERVVYDPASGQLVTGSFLDYCVPRADNVPSLATGLDQTIPNPGNPLGAKGAGEIGAVAAPPAIINAVLDALRPLGVVEIDMPATPEAVWRAIAEARTRGAEEGDSDGG